MDFSNITESKILSDNFFSSLNLPIGTDDEILESICAADTIEETEKALKLLRDLRDKLIQHRDLLDGERKELDSQYREFSEKIIGEGYGIEQIASGGRVGKWKRVEHITLGKDTDEGRELLKKLRHCESILSKEGEMQIKIDEITRKVDGELTRRYKETFLSRLKETRTKLKFTQGQVANELGVSTNAVSQYETGRRDVPLSALIRLSKMFNKPSDWLLGLT